MMMPLTNRMNSTEKKHWLEKKPSLYQHRFVVSEHPGHPAGLGVNFNRAVWQMALARYHGSWAIPKWKHPQNPYRQAVHGDDVFEYYFEVDRLGPNMLPPWHDDTSLYLSGHNDWTVETQERVRPIAQLFKPLPALIQQAEEFFRQMTPPVMAVHVRGTDKLTEYNLPHNDQVYYSVDRAVQKLKAKSVFLMTDSSAYAKALKPFVPFMLDIPRTNEPLHLSPPVSPYQSGAWAMLDGIIGSMCDHFLYTPSNFATLALCWGKHKTINRIPTSCQIEPFDPAIYSVLPLPLS